MATKKVEVDEKVIAIQAQMDQKVEEIHQVEQEQAELQALLDARVQQIKDSYQSKFDTLGNNIQYLTTELKAMFEQVPQKATKTQRKVSLLSGDVVVKNASQKLDYDKKLLLEDAEAHGMNEYILTKEVRDFDWTSFKATLEILEDGLVINKDTGEVMNMEGLSVVEVPEQVVIK
ncbi:MAG: host-nuclease inhibitor Gam family protein [Cellulosilyticaceae bacterium]